MLSKGRSLSPAKRHQQPSHAAPGTPTGPAQLLRRSLVVPPELLFEDRPLRPREPIQTYIIAFSPGARPRPLHGVHRQSVYPHFLQHSGHCRLRLQAQVPICSVRGVSSGILNARAEATTSSFHRRHAAVFPSSTGRTLVAVHGQHRVRGQYGPLAQRRRCPPRHARGCHVPGIWQRC